MILKAPLSAGLTKLVGVVVWLPVKRPPVSTASEQRGGGVAAYLLKVAEAKPVKRMLVGSCTPVAPVIAIVPLVSTRLVGSTPTPAGAFTVEVFSIVPAPLSVAPLARLKVLLVNLSLPPAMAR